MSLLPKEKTPPKTDLRDLSVLVYGRSKIGKSTFCAQSDGALFLACEAGLNHLDVFQIPITNWEKLLVALNEIAEGKHPFKTIVIDTVDLAYRFCADYICQKHSITHESDFGYGKGFSLVNGEFQRVMTRLSHLPYGLYLISHAQEKEFETRTGKVTRIIPTLSDKARKIVLGLVDIILYADVEQIAEEEGKTRLRRVLRTKPTLHYEAGDRTGRLPEMLDLDYQKYTKAFYHDDKPAAPVEKPPAAKQAAK